MKIVFFLQRREAALLKTFLPEKYEYVLFIPMTDIQVRFLIKSTIAKIINKLMYVKIKAQVIQ